jgi:hypothetical protein
MRSVLGRVALPLGAFVFMLGSSSSAAPPSDARVMMRGTTPWIHLGGRYVGPQRADVEARARAIVRMRTDAAAQLVRTGLDRFGDGDTIVRFEQSHRGLPVIGRGASVRLSAKGEPIVTVVDLERDLPATATPTVSPADAARIASTRFAIPWSPGSFLRAGASDAHLVVWPTLDRGVRLAWAVVPRVPGALATAPRAIVDAQTGEVLEVRDMVVFAKANTYPFNPAKTPSTVVADLPLPPAGKTLSNPFIDATNCIDRKTVKPISVIGFNLDVHVCDLVQVAVADENGDFLYEPSDVAGSTAAREDAFSEVSIYYHAAKAYAFFRDLQKDPLAQVVVDKPLRLVANLQVPAGLLSGNIAAAGDPDTPLEPFQNAFFSPAGGGLGAIFQQLYGFDSGALWFGQGPKRDYAYDGDVVYHEFSHAVVDATLKLGAWYVDARGAIDAPGAMNEALADYFSSAITGDPAVGEYAALDLGDQGDAIRSLVNTDRCPTALVGEVHVDSTVFSGALWQARTSLPEAERPRFDVALYKSMRTNPGRGDLGFADLAMLLLATLSTDMPAGAEALEAAMTDRGILPACERIVTFEGEPIRAKDRRLGFVAPGKQVVSVRGTAPGILQVRAALPPKTATVTVGFTARSGGVPSPLPGGGKAFAPLVLVKLGSPITWDPKSKSGHDADMTAKAEGDGEASATFEIAEDSTADSIYVQIANAGDSSGAYDAITFSFTSRDGSNPEEEAPPGSAPAVTTNSTDDGCAAAGRPTTAGSAGALSIVVAIAALLRRRAARR